LIYLAVDDEAQLAHWCWRLETKNVPYAEFREPDRGGELTAVAAATDGKVFARLRLM